jgi:hypothetical protein
MIQIGSSASGTPLEFVEFAFTAVSIGIAVAFPSFGARIFSTVERAFRQLARKQSLSVFVTGLAELLLRLIILPFIPIPRPFIPDDFSFLLAAKTFLLGRLTNPTPAMWTHFESIHITMVPTYMSMYFPAQGLILAAGKLVFGNPWFGLLFVTAAMCSALCWMLQAWLPPEWALLGGFLAILRLGLFSYWINTFTGAASIAALGGCLILGAFPRIMKKLRHRDCLLLSLGIILVAASRPYEGLLLCIPVAYVLGRSFLFSKARIRRTTLVRYSAIPISLIIMAGLWMGYYDKQVYGKPLTLPYTVDRATYAVAPYWIWQHARPEPVYRHSVMRDFYVKGEYGVVAKYHTAIGFVLQNLNKPFIAIRVFAGITLLPPIIMFRRVLNDCRIRFFLWSGAVWLPGMFIVVFLLPHYLAPFTAAFYVLGLQCMRHLRVWKSRQLPVGLTMLRLLITTCLLLAVARTFAMPLHLTFAEWPGKPDWVQDWWGPGDFGASRAKVQTALENAPGKQLVLVRYSNNHDALVEWVYNDPDIDTSKVIWAREMDAHNNQELIDYYKYRRVWLVEPDANPAKLSPYPTSR